MDFTQWGSVAALVASPLANVVLTFFVWKLVGEMKEVKKALNENGFVKQKDLDASQAVNDEVHRRQEEHLERQDDDVVTLKGDVQRLYQEKLSVRDYERERVAFVRKPRGG